MRACVVRRCAPADPLPPFEHRQKTGEPRPFDAQGLRNRGLRAAWIGLDHQQDRVLRGANFHLPQGLDEILKYPDLQTTQEITEVVFELPDPEAFFRAPFVYGGLYCSTHWIPGCYCENTRVHLDPNCCQ